MTTSKERRASTPSDHPLDLSGDAGAETLPADPSSERASGPASDLERLPIVDPATYAIAGEFARGGLGRILRAKDRRLDRVVALKVLHEEGEEVERRFVREAEVTARLQHPAIVPIYEAGRFPNGDAFYAMRLVSGKPLNAVLAACKNVGERLALLPHVARAAEAVAYAHGQRFIHRDLKPENVLVGELGETVVIDWGLAKDLSEDTGPDLLLEGRTSDAITRNGAILGTPVYMPPEQALGKPVDERADVYSLGAILYHLLAGRLPYEDKNPLRVLKAVATEPPPSIETVEPGAPLELVAIADKAMKRSPEERYPSAKELAEDLRRFQSGQLVGVHRYTPAELALRWARRHKAALSVAGVALAVVIASAGVSLARVVAERDRADRARHQAEEARATAVTAQEQAIARSDELTLLHARRSLDRDPTLAVAWLKRLSPGFQRWDEARTIAIEARKRGVSELHRGHEGDVFSLAFSPDGKHLASGSGDRSIRVWDMASQGGVVVLTGHGGNVTGLAFSRGGDQLASSSSDGSVRVWTLATSKVVTLSGHTRGALAVAFSPDGRRLASAGGAGEVRLWDVATGRSELFRDHEDAVISAAFSHDGKLVMSAGNDGTVRVRDLDGRASRVVWRGTIGVSAAAFSPSAALLSVAGSDGSIRVLDTRTWAERRLEAHSGKVYSLAFSADANHLVSSSGDTTTRLWDVRTGASRAHGSHDLVLATAISPDGATLASAGSDRMVRVSPADTGGPEAPGGGAALRAWLDGLTRATVDPAGALAVSP